MMNKAHVSQTTDLISVIASYFRMSLMANLNLIGAHEIFGLDSTKQETLELLSDGRPMIQSVHFFVILSSNLAYNKNS